MSCEEASRFVRTNSWERCIQRGGHARMHGRVAGRDERYRQRAEMRTSRDEMRRGEMRLQKQNDYTRPGSRQECKKTGAQDKVQGCGEMEEEGGERGWWTAGGEIKKMRVRTLGRVLTKKHLIVEQLAGPHLVCPLDRIVLPVEGMLAQRERFMVFGLHTNKSQKDQPAHEQSIRWRREHWQQGPQLRTLWRVHVEPKVDMKKRGRTCCMFSSPLPRARRAASSLNKIYRLNDHLLVVFYSDSPYQCNRSNRGWQQPAPCLSVFPFLVRWSSFPVRTGTEPLPMRAVAGRGTVDSRSIISPPSSFFISQPLPHSPAISPICIQREAVPP